MYPVSGARVRELSHQAHILAPKCPYPNPGRCRSSRLRHFCVRIVGQGEPPPLCCSVIAPIRRSRFERQPDVDSIQFVVEGAGQPALGIMASVTYNCQYVIAVWAKFETAF